MPPSEAGQGGENGGQVAYQQPSALFGNVPFSTDERGFIKRSLGMQLGPEFVATRQGPGGGVCPKTNWFEPKEGRLTAVCPFSRYKPS